MRGLAAEALALDTPEAFGPEHWWRSSSLPITRDDAGRVIACECAGAHDAPTPIMTVRSAVGDHGETPGAASFGELVRAWIDALDTGVWTYDAERDRWERDYEQAAEKGAMSALV